METELVDKADNVVVHGSQTGLSLVMRDGVGVRFVLVRRQLKDPRRRDR